MAIEIIRMTLNSRSEASLATAISGIAVCRLSYELARDWQDVRHISCTRARCLKGRMDYFCSFASSLCSKRVRHDTFSMEECFVVGQARECKYTAVDEVTTWLRILVDGLAP